MTSDEIARDKSHNEKTNGGYEKLKAEIAKALGQKYWNELVQNEPDIDWLAFGAKFYKKTHSVGTVICYSQGICVFRRFIQPKSIKQVIDETRAQPNSVYRLFDNFSTWCDAQGWMPRTTHTRLMGPKQLFIFSDIDIDPYKFKNKVSVPSAQEIVDPYPDNQTIRKILTFAPPRIRTFVQLLCDTGLEPIDATQLKVKNLKFDEDPVRGIKNREKTSERLEFFLSKETAAAIKQLIENGHKGQDDYIFTTRISSSTSNVIRVQYNTVVAKAGYGKLVKLNTTTYAKVDTLDGHPYGKFHLKVYKKRWFSLAIRAGIPEYIVQGMLGRRQYLDQYNRQPLDARQQFAKKILKAVNINAEAKTEDEKLIEAGDIMGIGKLTSEQAARLREALGMFMSMHPHELKRLLKQD